MQSPAIETSRSSIIRINYAAILGTCSRLCWYSTICCCWSYNIDFLVHPFDIKDCAAVVFSCLVFDFLGCFALAWTALHGAIPFLFEVGEGVVVERVVEFFENGDGCEC
tara:strand:- start:116 stop:442 length:327 start_codon:yes stop_codon:yes gene_type:complete